MNHKRRFLKDRRDSGFSLMELLIAISLFSTLLLVSVESFWKAESTIKDQDLVLRRVHLFQSLINVFGMPNSIRASIEQTGPTTHLARCIRGPNCITAGLRDLTLHLPPLFMSGTNLNISGPLSGPPSAPILFNLDGGSCNPATTTCDPDEFPIAVSTQYQAVCPPRYDTNSTGAIWSGPIYPAGIAASPGGNCIRAHYIKIFYRFEPTPGSSSAFAFKALSGTLMVSAVSIGYSR